MILLGVSRSKSVDTGQNSGMSGYQRINDTTLKADNHIVFECNGDEINKETEKSKNQSATNPNKSLGNRAESLETGVKY